MSGGQENTVDRKSSHNLFANDSKKPLTMKILQHISQCTLPDLYHRPEGTCIEGEKKVV